MLTYEVKDHFEHRNKMFYPYGGSKGNTRLIQRQPPAYTLIWEVPCLLNLRFPHLCNQQVLISLKLKFSFFVAATCYNRSFLQFVSSHGLAFPTGFPLCVVLQLVGVKQAQLVAGDVAECRWNSSFPISSVSFHRLCIRNATVARMVSWGKQGMLTLE